MITIYMNNAAPVVKLSWEIYKGSSWIPEDFSRANVKLWVIGSCNKWLVECIAIDGVISAEIPRTLPVGVYGVRAMWTKDDCCCKRTQSEVEHVFMVTDVPNDATPVEGDTCVIRIKSWAATYGYDGLSAYELAVLSGKTHLSEQEWIDAQALAAEKYEELLAALDDETERAEGAESNLQDQINAIVAGDANLALAATPSPVFVGVQSTINLTATTDTEASFIVIKKGETELDFGSGFSLSCNDTITPATDGNTTYAAEFTIAGLQKDVNKNVVAVYPIRIGSGASYVEGTALSTPKTSPAGTYNVSVAADSDYVWFNVPSTMTIQGATMGGFTFPLEEPETVEIDGVSYKSYKSSNTYDAGTLTIVIS